MPDRTEQSQRYLAAVREHADNVLKHGRDVYGPEPTPLFTDGLKLETLEPITWPSPNGPSPNGPSPNAGEQDWVLCNLAQQQILFRVLAGLTNLTGEARYKQAALDAFRYALTNMRRHGLIFWGGHCGWDLRADRPAFAAQKGTQHELKNVHPFYELMWEADPVEAQRFIEAFWNGHVRDWLNLEFSRHAPLGEKGRPQKGDPWENTYKGGPVFFVGEGLTFINTGTDLAFSAATLSQLSGDQRPLTWAKRLLHRYVETRNVHTGLGGYVFSISQLPKGGRGDRAVDQLWPLLPRYYPIEPKVANVMQLARIVGPAAICKMAISETLGEAGKEFQQWAVEDLAAYGKHAYDPETNEFHFMLTEGVRLTGLLLEKDGYYGKAGQTIRPAKASPALLWSYAMGYRLSGDPFLWDVARSIARGNGLGDIGETPATGPSLDTSPSSTPSTTSTSPHAIFASLELHAATHNDAFLDLAMQVADNILANCRARGFLLPSKDRLYVKFDSLEALALLHLHGVLEGRRDLVPRHVGGAGAYSGLHDRNGRETSEDALFALRKSRQPL